MSNRDHLAQSGSNLAPVATSWWQQVPNWDHFGPSGRNLAQFGTSWLSTRSAVPTVGKLGTSDPNLAPIGTADLVEREMAPNWAKLGPLLLKWSQFGTSCAQRVPTVATSWWQRVPNRDHLAQSGPNLAPVVTSWWQTGAKLGPLCAKWSRFGTSLTQFGTSFHQLVATGTKSRPLGTKWSRFGTSCNQLVATGAKLGPLCAKWSRFGASCHQLVATGAKLGSLGTKWSRFGTSCHQPNWDHFVPSGPNLSPVGGNWCQIGTTSCQVVPIWHQLPPVGGNWCQIGTTLWHQLVGTGAKLTFLPPARSRNPPFPTQGLEFSPNRPQTTATSADRLCRNPPWYLKPARFRFDHPFNLRHLRAHGCAQTSADPTENAPRPTLGTLTVEQCMNATTPSESLLCATCIVDTVECLTWTSLSVRVLPAGDHLYLMSSMSRMLCLTAPSAWSAFGLASWCIQCLR